MLLHLLAGLLVCSRCAVTVGAAPLQWSVNLCSAPLLHLLSDGSGGCALVSEDCGSYIVTRFDNKGAVRYSKCTIPSVPILTACEKTVQRRSNSRAYVVEHVAGALITLERHSFK